MKYIYGAIIGGALVYGFLFTWEGIKGNTDSVYVYEPCPTPCPVLEECKECDIKIDKAKVFLDTRPYLDTIKALNAKISDLKASNKYCEDKCINF